MIDHEALCQLIPHDGKMCLLDKVLHWDQDNIHCQSNSHQSASNPLRDERGLAAIHAVEYAAQAMAVHGGLLAREQGNEIEPGYVVALKDVQLHRRWLHDLNVALDVHALALTQSAAAMIYRFQVVAGEHEIAVGRITVMNQTVDKTHG